MFLQVEIKCLEDKNIDFKYTQCVLKNNFRPTNLGFFKVKSVNQ
jgi:hypothetical protein